MAAPTLAAFDCQLAITTTAQSLWTLLQAYFAANRPLDLPNLVAHAATCSLQGASTNGGSVIVSDNSSAPAPGLALTTAVGFELTTFASYFLPFGGSPAGVDLTAIWLYSSTGTQHVNVHVRRN